MKVEKIKKSWMVSHAHRIDAPFHLSDGIITRKKIGESPYETISLDDATEKIFFGNIFKRTFVSNPELGIPYITGSEMMKADIDTERYLSKKLTKKQETLMIKKNWILLSCSGTIGNVVFTNNDFEGKIGTHDLIRIIPSDNEVKRGFLFAYLKSRFGYALLTQSGYGGVVKHIDPGQIKDLPIPVFKVEKQNLIHQLIIDAELLREEGTNLLSETDEAFTNELNLDRDIYLKLISSTEKKFCNHFSLKNSPNLLNSFRARNHSVRKHKIIDLFKSVQNQNLGELLKTPPFYGARYKRIESESGIELLSQGDVFQKIPNGRKISKRTIKNLKDEISPKGATIIPAQGTLGENEIFGRAKFIWGYLEDKLLAGHLMRFIPDTNKISEGYLFTVLNSKLFFRILRNSVYGTNLLGFIVPMLIEIPIPRLSVNIEKEIDIKAKQAYLNFTKANELEAKAINLIETEIDSWQN